MGNEQTTNEEILKQIQDEIVSMGSTVIERGWDFDTKTFVVDVSFKDKMPIRATGSSELEAFTNAVLAARMAFKAS